MLTEADAKTKWCPMARCITAEPDGMMKPGQPARNRIVEIDGDDFRSQGSCIASGCMMWRWGPATYRRFVVAKDPARTSGGEFPPPGTPESYEWRLADPDDPDRPAGWTEPQADADARRKGFCGVAGRADD